MYVVTTDSVAFSYVAEFLDADDVAGIVHATGFEMAIARAADDLQRQVGTNPINYGALAKLTLSSETGTMGVTVAYGDDD